MELTVEEIRGGFNTGDRQRDVEMINSFLSGDVSVKTDEGPTGGEPAPDQIEDSVSPESVNDEAQSLDPGPVIDDSYLQELEQQRAYAELLEKRRQEEREEHLRELQRQREEAVKERAAREELEKRLQELESLRTERPTTPNEISAEDEEEEYASEYVKRTRQMVEELKATVGATDPVVKELRDKIEIISSEYDRERTERKKIEEEKAQREAEERQYKTVRDFQTKYTELQTHKDIREIEKDYFAFRKKLADITGVRSVNDLEKKIEDYNKGGETKKLAEKYGVNAPADYDKYLNILELIEMKRGLRYDPVLGKETPILDDEGKPVRYRSLEEAYRIKNYEAELAQKKREAYKDVSRKLQEVKQSAVTLPPDSVEQFTTGLTTEQERMYLNMDPREWSRDPEKKKMVEHVYRKYGLDVPQFRGRR